jgi:hypothetical protein
MKKGVNALELIFGLFILIVVVLVVIRMFISKMSLGGIETPVEDITKTYNYAAAYSQCESICSKYEADCSDTRNAVTFCLQKVSIDIDGDGGAGKEGQYNVVEGIPLCEDGVYCFHIKTCACGSFNLDTGNCLKILCEYYRDKGFDPDEDVSMQMIKKEINYGSCKPNIALDWKIDYKPIKLPQSYHSDWTDKNITYMGPDYWWAKAGYNSNNCSAVI